MLMHCQDLGWRNLWWKEALEPFASFVDFLSQHPSGGKKQKDSRISIQQSFMHIKACVSCVCVIL